MQQAVDLWQIGIESTGGALVPEKSFWSEVAFQWDNIGQWSYIYMTTEKTPKYLWNTKTISVENYGRLHRTKL